MNFIEGLPDVDARDDQYVAIDTEIFQIPDGKMHRPVGNFASLQITFDGGNTFLVTDQHDIPEAIRRIRRGKWVLQNAIFDIRQLRRFTEIQPRKLWDTMLFEQAMFGGYYSGFAMTDLARRWLNILVEKDVRDDFKTATEMTPQMKEYAARDAQVTLGVGKAQMKWFESSDETMDHYWMADLPAMWAVLDMKPAIIDVPAWIKNAQEMKARVDTIKASLPFNPGSWQQVKKVVEQAYRRSIKDTTEDTIREIYNEAVEDGNTNLKVVLEPILEFKSVAHLSSTYGESWLKCLENEDEVYTDYKINGAGTGRLSSVNPNMQNLPSKTMPIFRTFFICRSGEEIAVWDVKSQEPRITAALTHDKNLTECLRTGESPHIRTGKMIYHDPNFSKDDPRYPYAKSLNLGLSYGMTAKGLAVKTGLSVSVCEVMVESYFKAYPGVKSWIDKTRLSGLKLGYVKTVLGRKFYLNPHAYRSSNNAINAPVQGTAAEQTKMAMGLIHKECQLQGVEYPVSATVHDEIDLRYEKELRPVMDAIVTEAWMQAGRRTLNNWVPQELETGHGSNWGCKS